MKEGIERGALQQWQVSSGQPEGKPYREVTASPDLKSVRITSSEDAESNSPPEEYEVPADFVRRAKWRARKALILHQPETIALRFPFFLAGMAVLSALLDWALRGV